jgi:hypothetical protein
MFSATKFVVAGVIVALFGGFLISGVLTTRPSEESQPAVGASASASTDPDSTVAATAEIDPAEPVTTVISDLLPGVDLATEEIEPGVFRVLDDGVRDLTEGVRDFVVSASGDVWVMSGNNKNVRVVRLGEPGVSHRLGDAPELGLIQNRNVDPRPSIGGLGLTREGTPLIHLKWKQALIYDGDRWVEYEGEVDLEPSPCAEILIDNGAAAAHGSCWVPVANGLDRHFDGGSELIETAAIGLAEGQWVDAAVADEDGTLWATVHDDVGRFSGLLRFDGDIWTRVPYESKAASAVGEEHSALVVAPDGTLWVQRTPPFADSMVNPVTFTSWDGDTWTDYGPVDYNFGYDWWDRNPTFRPDGTIWFYDGQIVFDGKTVHRSELPRGDLVFGPGDTAWLLAGMGIADRRPLYIITPEAAMATD